MAPGNSARSSHLAQAAARRLGLEPDIAPEAARAMIFSRLREDGFLLDPESWQAVMFLYGRPIGYSSFVAEESAAEEERLRDQVEIFAARFFALPLDERLARWQALVQQCAPHASLLDWLRKLEPGLRVGRESFASGTPAVVQLAEDILTLWVLRPKARAALSRELAARFRSNPKFSKRERARACWRLQRLHANVAALSRGYFEEIAAPSISLKKALRYRRVNRRFRLTGVIVGAVISVIALVIRTESQPEGRQSVRPVQPSVVRQPGRASPMPAAAPQSILEWHGPNRPPVRFAVGRSLPGQALPPQLVQFFREQFKGALIRELAKFGKTLDENKLQIVVECLPEDLAGIQADSAVWTAQDYDRSVSALEAGLAHMGLALSRAQLKEVARASVPKAFLGPVDFRPVLIPSGQPAIPL